jgi:hypothetical protein
VKSCRRGQSLVESTVVMLVFFALLLGVLDCGQILFAHQSLVERVRAAVRWGTLHPEDGPDRVVNYVLYGRPDAPPMTTLGFLGLTEENVRAEYRTPTALRPDDDLLHVEIVNFESHLFAPWFAKALISPRPVSVTAPVMNRAAE